MSDFIYEDDLLLLPTLDGVDDFDDFAISLDGIEEWFQTNLLAGDLRYSDFNILDGHTQIYLDDRSPSVSLAKGTENNFFVGSGMHSIFASTKDLNLRQTDGETLLYVESFSDFNADITLDTGTIKIMSGDLELKGLVPDLRQNKIFFGDFETGINISVSDAENTTLIVSDLSSASSTTLYPGADKITGPQNSDEGSAKVLLAHENSADEVESTTFSQQAEYVQVEGAATPHSDNVENASDISTNATIEPSVFLIDGSDDIVFGANFDLVTTASDNIELELDSFLSDANDELHSIYSEMAVIQKIEQKSRDAEEKLIEVNDYDDLNIFTAIELIEEI